MAIYPCFGVELLSFEDIWKYNEIHGTGPVIQHNPDHVVRGFHVGTIVFYKLQNESSSFMKLLTTRFVDGPMKHEVA